jgi:restriction system protein
MYHSKLNPNPIFRWLADGIKGNRAGYNHQPTIMWERRISHAGLNAFRVIRGSDENDVNIKAELQLKIWNEKWQRLQQKRVAVFTASQKKLLAEFKSREAQAQLSAISTTLLDSLPKDHCVNWEELRDGSPFGAARPEQPIPS